MYIHILGCILNYTRLVKSHICITLFFPSLQICVLPLHLVKPEFTPLPCGRRLFVRYLGVSIIFPVLMCTWVCLINSACVMILNFFLLASYIRMHLPPRKNRNVRCTCTSIRSLHFETRKIEMNIANIHVNTSLSKTSSNQYFIQSICVCKLFDHQ